MVPLSLFSENEMYTPPPHHSKGMHTHTRTGRCGRAVGLHEYHSGLIRSLKDRMFTLKVFLSANDTEKGMYPFWDTVIQEEILYAKC